MNLDNQVFHHQQVIPASVANTYMSGIIKEIPWRTPTSRFGRYHYAWHVSERGQFLSLDMAISVVELFLNRKVRGAFVNYYENGEHKTGEHTDPYGCDIAGLSLGATRDLYFRHNQTKEKTNYVLNSGDIMVMMQSVNTNYKHAVPVRKRVKQPRVNITCFLEEL
jgi:alkylated DNA repair dioxygenase AlkB